VNRLERGIRRLVNPVSTATQGILTSKVTSRVVASDVIEPTNSLKSLHIQSWRRLDEGVTFGQDR